MDRWRAAGRPATVPPPVSSRQEQGRRARAMRGASFLARVEDYFDLTRNFRLRQEQAAERMGVSIRTVERYENEIEWRGMERNTSE